MRDPLLNLIVSNDEVYVIALLLRTFTDSANCLHFAIISDADRELTDMQIARPLCFCNALNVKMPATQKLLPIWRDETQIFRLAGLVKNVF